MLFSTVDDCYVSGSGRKSVGKKPSVFLTSHSKQKFRQTTDMQAKKNSSNVCQTICGCWAKGEDAWESKNE